MRRKNTWETPFFYHPVPPPPPPLFPLYGRAECRSELAYSHQQQSVLPQLLTHLIDETHTYVTTCRIAQTDAPRNRNTYNMPHAVSLKNAHTLMYANIWYNNPFSHLNRERSDWKEDILYCVLPLFLWCICTRTRMHGAYTRLKSTTAAELRVLKPDVKLNGRSKLQL